jgi:hypothetical protein
VDPSLSPLILVALCLAVFAYVFKDIARRRRAMFTLAATAAESSIKYACPVTVRMRSGNRPWSDLKTGFGPPAELVVRQGFLEVGLTPGSHRLTAQLGSFWIVWRVENTTVHRERVGWVGSRLLARQHRPHEPPGRRRPTRTARCLH